MKMEQTILHRNVRNHTTLKRASRFLLFAALLGAALAQLPYASQAALSPGGGTLTDASGPLIFTGGPYAVANPSSQATGTPTCNPVLVCDEYALTVSGISTATTQSKYIRIEVKWQELGEAQFDLYVFSGTTATGHIIASSLGNQTYVDPDVVLIPAVNGTYTLRVVPFNPQGLGITGTVSLVPFPAVAPVTPGEAPAFSNYVSPSNLGNSAGEPSIGVDWAPRVASLKHDQVNTGGVTFFTAGEEQLRVSFNDAVSPAAALWEDTAAPVQPGLDPIGFVDHQTGRIFGLQLAAGDANAAYSDDDGLTWTPTVAGGAPAGPDHETLGGGPYNNAAVPPAPPHPTYANAVYYCSQNVAGGAECSRSDNGGVTFGPGVDIFNPVECYGGIHGHVKVGPDGTVYVPNSSCSAGTGSQGVAVSRDNGITWTDFTVPGSVGSGDPSIGIGSDNTVYLGYVNGDGRPHIAVSTDHGTTWTNDYEVGLPVGCAPGDQYADCRIKSAVFPTVVAGDGDRAAFGFLGSTTGGNYQDLATFQGIWNFYVATTYDRGAHWVTVNATPGDPVQKGAICLAGILCSSANRNLLDFNDITVDKEGRSLGAYADGCVAPACVAPNYSGRLNKAAIVRQSSGRRLFAAFDPVRTNYALLSLGGSAVGSSLHFSGSYPAAAAINGDRTGNAWGTAAGGWNDGTRGVFPDTLEVDFITAKTIDEINVVTLQNNWQNAGEPTLSTSANLEGLLDYSVEYWNGTAWVSVASVTGNDKAWRQFTFSAVTTTKIRLVINNARNNWSRVVEFEAVGPGGQ